MLRNPHPPEDHGVLAPCPYTRAIVRTCSAGNTSELLDQLRGILLDRLLQRSEILGSFGDELWIGESFIDDDVHETIEKCDIRSRLVSNVMLRMVSNVRATGINHNECCSALGSLLEKCRRDRDDSPWYWSQSRPRHPHIEYQQRHWRLHQNRWFLAVPQPRRHDTGGYSGPHCWCRMRPNQLLEQIGFFVGALGRPESQPMRQVHVGRECLSAASHQVKRFFPRGFTEGGHHLSIIDDSAGFAFPLAIFTSYIV